MTDTAVTSSGRSAGSSSSASGEPPAITGRAPGMRAPGAGASDGECIQTAAMTRR